MKRALIVVAKVPSPGQTKTRLCPALTAQEAVELYRAFLLDTLHLMQQVQEADHVIAYLPEDAEPYFRTIAPQGFLSVPQRGEDLGQRLSHVLASYLADGYDQAVVMNSDGPTLPASYLMEAFRRLDQPEIDVVLGPSDDGGYYLIGLKRACSALFEVTMSTPTVLDDTLERAHLSGLAAACLPPWYDVDVHEDLARLIAELDSLPEAVARFTRRFLSGLGMERLEILTDSTPQSPAGDGLHA
ncbi:MAG: TIGR04282 family arsenosugar biosynthesis glycosyltransferase [Anaerolineae bacterium]|nr:TIGR04282 family arsenosugar biosynthesis glycosyltransferase [Anaerolineae bacterium]